MAYDETSFLQGVVIGKGLKGFSSASLEPGYAPACWNEAGVYDCFYIDFHGALAPFSGGQFRDSVLVTANGAILDYGDVKRISDSVVQVRAGLSSYTHGLRVYGSPESRLAFSGGKTVPKFAVSFYVAGLDVYVDMAYLYDQADFSKIFTGVEERVVADYVHFYDPQRITESAAFTQITSGARDAAKVNYYPTGG